MHIHTHTHTHTHLPDRALMCRNGGKRDSACRGGAAAAVRLEDLCVCVCVFVLVNEQVGGCRYYYRSSLRHACIHTHTHTHMHLINVYMCVCMYVCMYLNRPITRARRQLLPIIIQLRIMHHILMLCL
jgi:hypothetical protein